MSQYLRYTQLTAPLHDVPNSIQPLQLPTLPTTPPFDYDFAVEREAIDIAKAAKRTEAECKQNLEEYEQKKRQETQDNETKRIAAERKMKQAREATAAATAERKQKQAREATAAATALVEERQKKLAQHEEEERERVAQEQSQREGVLLRSRSRQADDRETAETQRQKELVTQFGQWTGANEEVCEHYLSAHTWKLDEAVRQYFGRANN